MKDSLQTQLKVGQKGGGAPFWSWYFLGLLHNVGRAFLLSRAFDMGSHVFFGDIYVFGEVLRQLPKQSTVYYLSEWLIIKDNILEVVNVETLFAIEQSHRKRLHQYTKKWD